MSAAYISSYKWQTSVWRPSNFGQARYATLIALKKICILFRFVLPQELRNLFRASAVGLQQPEQSQNFRTLVHVRRHLVPTSSPELILFGRRTSDEGTNVCKTEVVAMRCVSMFTVRLKPRRGDEN